MVAADPTPKLSPTRPVARLRILATTDLHGHLLPHDYIKDEPTQGGGLAGLARLIKEARAQAAAESVPVLLLDNGDTFQGTPLATDLAGRDVTAEHPIIASLNYLEYDAVGLGNHDLDHGMPYLKAAVQALKMPMISSNFDEVDLGPLRHRLLLPVDLGPDASAPLTVGILSVLPAQSAAWHRHHLGALSSLRDPAEAVAIAAEQLRQEGADLVIVLAHMGVGHRAGETADAQAAQALARCGAVDALILGHTHRRLPSADYASRAGVDHRFSTVGGVPAIMAGHAGSDLGIMDLELAHDTAKGWQIAKHSCLLQPNGANVFPDPVISAFAHTPHRHVCKTLSQPVAQTPKRLHSYFSLACPAPTQELTARARHQLVSAAVQNTPYADLPILAASAAHSAGGRDGPGNYVDIPAGAVLRRHITGLTPFENHTIGIRINGAGLFKWLEHAALLFNTLVPDDGTQHLVNGDVPAFQFDTIYGLEYDIDPTAPPYARIKNLTFAGEKIADAQEFILGTNQFRVAGGGGYGATPENRIINCGPQTLQNTMIDILNNDAIAPWQLSAPWRFAPSNDVKAILLTHPDAVAYLSDIAQLHPIVAGSTSDGFLKLSVTL